MSSFTDALEVLERPMPHQLKGLPLRSYVEEAIRGIIKEAPKKGIVDFAPDIEGLGHLVRVLINAESNYDEQNVVGFLRLQLMQVEEMMKQYPGDSAGALRRLGCIFARALVLLGRADEEVYRVPYQFRTKPT